MSGRGRGGRGGRGGGANKSFSREQLNSMGVTSSDVLPVPVTQPPPLYPVLNRKPVALTTSTEIDYLLLLKQDYIDRMHLSGAFVKTPESKDTQLINEIDKLVAQLPDAKEKFDWKYFPTELRPKVVVKHCKKEGVVNKDIDIRSRLEKLEKMEEKRESDVQEVVVKTEVDNDEVEEEGIEYQEDEDEEMDDGTDYANNYFNNGEEYEDEDENLDDGPSY